MKHYTEEELKAIVEKAVGVRAKDIEKIELVGLWHVRFRAFGTDFTHLKESKWCWPTQA